MIEDHGSGSVVHLVSHNRLVLAKFSCSPELCGAERLPCQQTSETKTAYARGKEPDFRRAAASEDEDCVRVKRMVGPDGWVHVTRGLICQE
jgi:hypothetical protein